MAGTPFDLEEQQQESSGRLQWDPSKGPTQPSYFAGLGYDDHGTFGAYDVLKKGALSGVDKGLQVLGSVYRSALDTTATDSSGEVADAKGSEYQGADAFSAHLRERIKANTPNANTTGAAGDLLHGLVSGATEMAAGGLLGGPAGAAAVVGSAEGVNRAADLRESGVDDQTAARSGLLAGAIAALGAVLPAGFGSTLLSKVATGAAANAGLGILNRYADHTILEAAGYADMANQQKVMDSTQVLTDLILGGGFGVLAHLHSPEIERLRNEPGARDAALTTNLALKDRDTAPGVPTDPAAANAHQAALEKGIADLMEGQPVDVSDAGVHEADFLERPDAKDPQAEPGVRETVSDPEFFGEDNARAVQDILDGREPQAQPKVERSAKWLTDGKPIWEMSADELGAHADRLDENDVTTLTSIFGHKDDAVKFNRLATSNRDSAHAASERMIEKLSPENQRLIAHWEQGGGIHALNASDVRDLEKAVRSMHEVETPADLADRLKHSLTNIGDAHDPRTMKHEEMKALLETKAAHEVATAKGWDLKEVSDSALKAAAARFKDPADAEFMLQRFLKKPERGVRGERLGATDQPVKANPLIEQERPAAKGEKPEVATEAPGEKPEGAPDDSARIISEKPDLMIPDEETGQPVRAADALARASEEVANTRRESTIAAKTAIQCYLRRGG